MPRKILLLSTSLLCLSFVSGPVFAAPAASAPYQPIILAKADNSNIVSTAKTAAKKTKATKSTTDSLSKAAKKATKTKEPKAVKDKLTDKATTAKAGRKTAGNTPSRSYQRSKPSTQETSAARQNRADGQSLKPITGSENCACADSAYCIGPRGGHYCYTSGGNKRYLPRN